MVDGGLDAVHGFSHPLGAWENKGEATVYLLPCLPGFREDWKQDSGHIRVVSLANGKESFTKGLKYQGI